MSERGKRRDKRRDKMVDIGIMKGWVEVIVKDKHGRVKYHIGFPPKKRAKHNPVFSSFPTKETELFYWRKNVITDVGLACIIRLVFAFLAEDKFGYLAIGSGTTAEAVTDTALEYEVKRKLATVTQTTTTITDDTALLEATFSSADAITGTMTISETGIFNLDVGGDLLARKVFAGVPIDWDAGDTLTIRYYVQQTR